MKAKGQSGAGAGMRYKVPRTKQARGSVKPETRMTNRARSEPESSEPGFDGPVWIGRPGSPAPLYVYASNGGRVTESCCSRCMPIRIECNLKVALPFARILS